MAKLNWLAGWLAVLCILPHTALAARQWRAVSIPGAQCGDGAPYQVMVSAGDPRNVAIELMGGGACWNFQTCVGPDPLTSIHPISRVLEVDGFVSDDPARSPAAGYTLVYFPYCTGDVHVGAHTATYTLAKVRHVGKQNFELALKHLTSSGIVDLRWVERFILYGYSAGAIGALFHVFTVAPYLEHATTKVLLADAPGLHFGDHFWEKFSAEFLRDFGVGMDRAGVRLHRNRGNIASVVPALCRLFPDWRVGVLQGSRDLIMSTLFGDISPDKHEELIYSAAGVYGLTLDPKDNCSAWVPSTAQHTFLVTDATSGNEASGKSAMDFAFDTVLGSGGGNYR